jgi:hypothetical protein
MATTPVQYDPMDRTGIYTRHHDAEAWKFERIADPINAQLAADVQIPGDTDQMLFVRSRAQKATFSEFLDSCQPQFEGDHGNMFYQIVRVK